MNKENLKQYKAIFSFALPISIQSMIQTSFSIVDQLMISRLGSDKIAGIGVVNKFILIFNILVNAIAIIAGIMISQFEGANKREEAEKSLNLNLSISLAIGLIFMLVGLFAPQAIMRFYTPDVNVITIGAGYLRIISFSTVFSVLVALLSTYLRCHGKVRILLIFGVISTLLNTLLNYLLIFGKAGAPRLGEKGAAIATVISIFVQMCLCIFAFVRLYRENSWKYTFGISLAGISFKKYMGMLLPVFVTDVLWSVGESVYVSIYGHIGTDALAAISLVGPLFNLTIAAYNGFSQAGSILVGKALGNDDFDKAYTTGKRVMICALITSLVLAVPLILLRGPMISLFAVSNDVYVLASQLMLLFLLYMPLKAQNMVVGGGIVRSGGNTKIIMILGFICTWLIGIPLALISSHFVRSICFVYAVLSLEEVVRFVMLFILFKKKKWMQRIEVQNG